MIELVWKRRTSDLFPAIADNAGRKSRIPLVDFTNILCARFSYKSKLSSFYLITFGFAIF